MRIQCRFFSHWNFAEEVHCTSKVKLALLAHALLCKDYSRKCGKCFITSQLLCWKIACHTVLQSLQIFIPQQLLQRKMFFITVVAWRRSDIFIAKYYNSTVQQSLVIKISNADLQLQADFAISHSYNTKADYSPHSDCAAAQSQN